MSFKYYDILSSLIVGIVAFYAIWMLAFPSIIISDWVVIPAGYVVGYFLNAISNFIEPVMYITICGKPSNKLLTPVPGREWTGIRRVKFYFAEQTIESLKEDLGDEKATTEKMFDYAKSVVNTDKNSRVPDFNGHYALSRVILTTSFVAVVLVEIRFYYIWYSWVISIVLLFFAWNRYRERGYYYAREVLSEYLKTKR